MCQDAQLPLRNRSSAAYRCCCLMAEADCKDDNFEHGRLLVGRIFSLGIRAGRQPYIHHHGVRREPQRPLSRVEPDFRLTHHPELRVSRKQPRQPGADRVMVILKLHFWSRGTDIAARLEDWFRFVAGALFHKRAGFENSSANPVRSLPNPGNAFMEAETCPRKPNYAVT